MSFISILKHDPQIRALRFNRTKDAIEGHIRAMRHELWLIGIDGDYYGDALQVCENRLLESIEQRWEDGE